MQLKIIGSSSSGNGYIIDDGNDVIILELGCRREEYAEALNHDISRARACLVSHGHG